jgi:hypothetical protein
MKVLGPEAGVGLGAQISTGLRDEGVRSPFPLDRDGWLRYKLDLATDKSVGAHERSASPLTAAMMESSWGGMQIDLLHHSGGKTRI